MSIIPKLAETANTKTEIKTAIESKGYDLTDKNFNEYPNVIDSMKEWQQLSQFGIPQDEIDEKNSKWLDGIAYANELLAAYPNGNIPNGVLDKERLVIYPFSSSPSGNVSRDFFSGSNLEYIKDNIFTWNGTYNSIVQLFQGCDIGNATINIPSTIITGAYAMNFSFNNIKFKEAIININSVIPRTGSHSFETIFGNSKGNILTLNIPDFESVQSGYIFTGCIANRLNINISNSSGSFSGLTGCFAYALIEEVNINTNVPIVWDYDYESFFNLNTKLKSISFDIISGTNMSVRSFFNGCSSLTRIEIFDLHNIKHLNNYDGYYSLQALKACSVLTSAKLKISEGIDLSYSHLDSDSITYLMSNLSYPTHSDYANNGGTLIPTIKVHPTVYTWLVNESTLLDNATALGYSIIE